MKKAKSRQEIAIEYGINRKTLQRWLDKENIRLPHRLLLPQEQDIIYKTFGAPVVAYEVTPINTIIRLK
jgi:DNA invertase Pin-like site-specific DNA recombinase